MVDKARPERPPKGGRYLFWLGASALAVAGLAGGVGMAAVLGRQGSPQDWSRWSDVGQTFGALSSIIAVLTLFVVVVTARSQSLESRRVASVQLSALHFEILKMSIDDPSLAEVWPDYLPPVSAERKRQYLYAHIIYQFHWTALQINKATDEQVLGSMRYLFTSHLMRLYWNSGQRGRTSLQPGSAEHVFAARLDEICRDYEAAVSAAKRNGSGPMTASAAPPYADEAAVVPEL
jgi:hypothetical protein